MDTVAIVDLDTPIGASYIKIDGDLRLKQKSPIDRTTFYNEFYYENIFDKKDANGNNFENQIYSFDEIANEYSNRNFSTYFDYQSYIVPMKNPKYVKIEVNINVPSFQKVLLTTPLFTKIKFFWIQYAAFLIPVGYIFYFITSFVFRNHIINTITSNDIGERKTKNLWINN